MTRPHSTRPESSVERFFLSRPLQLATVELDGSEAHHLLHVLRAKVGDRVGLFNGDGDEALAEVTAIRKRSAEMRIIETWTEPSEPRELTLAVALPKGDRARWLMEKATELGVTRLIPLRTARSIVEPGTNKLDKLEQTAIAACKQCGRSRLPKVSPLTPLADLLREISNAQGQVRESFIAHPGATLPFIQALSRNMASVNATLALIGPEGDFTEEEISAACAAGAQPVSLGSLVLRVETAAIALAAAWRMSNP